MYKEFRDLTRADAVKSLYQDMAARHRAHFRSIHVCVSYIDFSFSLLRIMHCRFRTLTFLSQILQAVEAIIKQVDGSEAHIAFPKRSTFVANDVLGIAWWGSYC